MYYSIIDNQIKDSNRANLFSKGSNPGLKFSEETVKAIAQFQMTDTETERMLIKYTTAKALEEFCRINQYYSFSTGARKADLVKNIKAKKHIIAFLEKNHYQNLRDWLKKTNPFSEKLYPEQVHFIEPVVCSEYSAEIQLNLFGLNNKAITEPILDIGCGKNGNLVRYLSKKGYHIKGIDRFTAPHPDLINADWLEFDYGKEKWGTIFSNLGFSNHFIHHNLRNDGNHIEYARKYMEILKSLKTGGKFIYTPELPFIELYLNNNQYHVEKHNIKGFDFKTTILSKLDHHI